MDCTKTLQLDHSWLKFYLKCTVEEMKKAVEMYEAHGITDSLMVQLRCLDTVYHATKSIDHLLSAHGGDK